MKRHPGLIPFSHDHHDGLVLAQRLLQGRSKSPRSQWPADLEGQRDRVLGFFADHLSHHLAGEEAILFPLARRHLGDQAALVDELQQEHEDLRRGLQQLASVEGPQLQKWLEDWARLLHDHIRKEERQLFQSMQERVPEEYLAACEERFKDFCAQRGRPQNSCLL